MKEAFENSDRDPDLAIRPLLLLLRHYPEGFEVRLPEYLDDIWRTQGEQAYWKAIIEGQIKGTLHPNQMARLTIGGLLARIFSITRKMPSRLFSGQNRFLGAIQRLIRCSSSSPSAKHC
jgi:hypothetical protein